MSESDKALGSPIEVIARAKINLTLHVGATLTEGRFKGYHPLDSLVVFADFGDALTFTPSDTPEFHIQGEFADKLEPNSDNLITRALRLCGAEAHSVALTKSIPVSAGLGGGSANAAAVLRQFDPLGNIDDATLGADIPVCRQSQTAMMRGIGERVTPLPNLGQVSAVLVNPRVSVSTGSIFKAFDVMRKECEPIPTQMRGTLLERAKEGRNDLEHFAIEQAPVIKEVLEALGHTPNCQLARMSGSGATCFALYRTDNDAKAAANIIMKNHPEWWVKPCRFGDE